jgi:asparagine synthase (glutamine-hydrolysing)
VCGLAGVYEPHADARRELLLAMAGELAHRGPDGTGLYLDGRFAMVNTRLAIVDIAGGDQPIGNEDKTLWVMQNGEIYNAPELRAELEDLGHTFTTHSDTEVIVHAYEAWGAGCLHRLNGEFAFAIWDRRKRELFLARDRFGVRPMFLGRPGGALVFASEAKAILRHPAATRALDPAALVETLELWQTLPDRSAFEGIRELPAGTYLRVGAGGDLEETRWWELRYVEREPATARSEEKFRDEVLAKLSDATRIRLRADVPVGVYLSGGLDSSVIAAMVRQISRHQVKAFSIHFEDPVYDERPFQEQMARALDVDLCSVNVTARDIADVFPDVIRAWEKPTLRTSPAPLLLLSRAVRDSRYKVVLTGEGADEIFAGYDLFKEDKVRRFWARHPTSRIRPRLFERIHRYLPGGGLARGAAMYFGRGLTETSDPLYSHRPRFEGGSRAARLLAPGITSAVALAPAWARIAPWLPEGFLEMTPLARAQLLEQRTFLEGYLLHAQGDRMLMQSGVEGRFPFLDVDVVEHAATIPDALRMMGLREKYILRKAVGHLLPAEIAKREKHPYRAPILRAFAGADRPGYVDEVFAPERVQRAGLFEPALVTRFFEHCTRNADAGVSERDEMALAAVLSTMLLHQLFVESPALAPAAVPTRVVVGSRVAS